MSGPAGARPRGGGPSGAPRIRSLGRELALKFLFAADAQGTWDPAAFERFVRDLKARGPSVTFARRLALGVIAFRGDLDPLIERCSANWTLKRMAVVDRNVLRLGAYEMLHQPDVPTVVAINEAIELAKKYGAAQSGAFVNGILDQLSVRAGGGGGSPA